MRAQVNSSYPVRLTARQSPPAELHAEPDHGIRGAGRRLDDVVGAPWVPAALGRDPVQRARQPRTSQHAPGAQHEADRGAPCSNGTADGDSSGYAAIGRVLVSYLAFVQLGRLVGHARAPVFPRGGDARGVPRCTPATRYLGHMLQAFNSAVAVAYCGYPV